MSPDNLATLIAAGVAAVAAIVAAVMSSKSAKATRKESARAADAARKEATRAARESEKALGREQWWVRFTWATEQAMSSDAEKVALGLRMLTGLISADWATREDQKMAATVASTIAAKAAGGGEKQ